MRTILIEQKKDNINYNNTTLVESAVGGDPAARETLAVKVLPRVQKLVRFYYGNHSDREDVVQTAMGVIFKDLHSLQNCNCFSCWLTKVVNNVVQYQGRQQIRIGALVSLSDYSEDRLLWDITPEDESIKNQFFQHLQYHLHKISPKKRTAIILSLFYGYINSEIAQTMECSVETAKKRVQQGRKELLQNIQRDPRTRITAGHWKYIQSSFRPIRKC